MIDVRKEIEILAEGEYQKFTQKLNPNLSKVMLGVRLPKLRELAKEIAKDDEAYSFLNSDEKYFEEVMLKGFVIAYLKIDEEERLSLISDFIPKIDNWSVCDSFLATLKSVKKNQSLYFDFLQNYIGKGEFCERFVAVLLMDYFINDNYVDEVLNIYSHLKNDGYYTKMGVAWGIATVAAKYPKKAYDFLDAKKVDATINNLSIKKMRESFRISDCDKEMLKTKIIKE